MTARAARSEIAGWDGETLRVRVMAPPAYGRANAAVERLLASALGLPTKAVRLVSGARSRDKVLAIDGMGDDEVRLRLDTAPAPKRR